MKNNCIRC